MPSARALGQFLREAQAAVRLRGAVSVLLTTDAEIQRLNRRFRGKNKATDVLSFPAAAPASQRVSKSASHRVSGDLAISVDTARRQSAEQGHALAVEVKVLMLHGLLHLAGFDHETDDGEMARRERLLRARLGLPLGLIERVHRNPGNQELRSSALATEGKRKDGARGLKVGQRASGKAAPSSDHPIDQDLPPEPPTARVAGAPRSAQDDKLRGGRA